MSNMIILRHTVTSKLDILKKLPKVVLFYDAYRN